jgi:tRNA-2-methylthio-N6-dimethylallyladenosine synthase
MKLYQDDISKEEKRDRWDELQVLMEKISLAKNEAFVGKTVSVLVDKVDNGYASGQSHEMKLTRFKCDDPSVLGRIVPVAVTLVKSWVLEGEIAA